MRGTYRPRTSAAKRFGVLSTRVRLGDFFFGQGVIGGAVAQREGGLLRPAGIGSPR
jgi:hypothetical protein